MLTCHCFAVHAFRRLLRGGNACVERPSSADVMVSQAAAALAQVVAHLLDRNDL